jgi:UDP-N-acetylmuramoyl-tripeptide--D-alanyl-D-alanine ligase
MKTILLLLFLLSGTVIRYLRWLALVQQKEYRADRLWAFLSTVEGLKELIRILPARSDFTRTGLKRPRPTARMIVVTVFSFSLLLLFFLLANLLSPWMANGWQRIFTFVSSVGMAVVLMPVFVILGTLPTVLLAEARTLWELRQARKTLLSSQVKIIGITGSYGKSSTKHILRHILAQQTSVFATPRSYNARFSVAASVVEGYSGQKIAILEYGAYSKGEIAELAGWLPPDVAIITGLAPQHLALFGSLDAIVKAKSELVKALPKEGVVYYNAADLGAKSIVDAGLLARGDQLQTIACYADKVDITKPALDATGKLTFYLAAEHVQTQLVGMHYLEAIALAVTVARSEGISNMTIIKALETFRPGEYMTTSYQLKNGALVIDDGGTSNPTGFIAALNLAKKLNKNRQLTLISPGIVDLGAESAKIHREIAEMGREEAQKILHVGQDGKQQFQALFKSDYYDDQEVIVDILSRLNEESLLLIEGRMPGWVLKTLEGLRVEAEQSQ